MTDYTRFTKLEAEEIKAKKVEGALPSVTSADVGKALTVEAKVVDDKVVAPEQTSTYNEDNGTYPLDLDTSDASLFTEGATVKVSIANVEDFVGTVVYFEGDESYGVADSEGSPTWYVMYYPTVPSFGVGYDGVDNPPESITVTITTVHTEYEWNAVTPSGGGGYDIEIACNNEPSSAAYTDLTITSGSIEAVEAKVAEGKIPNGRLAFFYQVNGHNECRICELSQFDADYSALRFTNGEQLTTGKIACVVGFDSSYAISALSFQ